MFSDRRRALAFCLAALAVGLSSCWFRTGATPQSAPLEIGLTGCLDGATNTLGDFFSGSASERQVADLWNCVYSSLQMFEDRTTGANPDVYTEQELQRFLERYFLRNFKIPDGLMDEAMQLKVTLIGGDPEKLTKQELSQLRQLMTVLRDQSLALRPYLPLTAARVDQEDRATLDASIQTLRAAAGAIGRMLQEEAQPYAFSHLDRLLFEIESYTDNSEYKTALTNIRVELPLFQQIKKIFVSPDAGRMAGADWRISLSLGADAYSLFLRYSYAWNRDPSLIQGQGLRELVGMANDVYSLLSGVMRRDQDLVAFDDLDQVIDAMDPSYFSFAEPYRAPDIVKTHVRALVPVLTQKFLHDRANPAGITQASLDSLLRLFDQASTAQSYLQLLFQYVGTHDGHDDADPLAQFYLPQDLAAPSLQQVFGLSEPSSLQNEIGGLLHGLISGMICDSEVCGDDRPLFAPGDGQIAFDGYTAARKASFEGLSLESEIRLVVNLGYRAYVPYDGTADPDNLVATVDEIGVLFDDFQQLGIDLKLFNPDGEDVHVERFTEGDLFTYASNGDGLLQAQEATDLVSYLFSAKMLSTRIRVYMEANCPQDPHDPNNDIGTDVYGYPEYRAPCYEANFFGKAVPELWDHFPRLQDWYERLPSRQGPQKPGDGTVYQQTYMCLVDTVGRQGDLVNPNGPPLPPDPNWFNSGDNDDIAALLQYEESIFERFDRDGDGFLDESEARIAFPILKGELQRYIQAKNLDPYGVIRTDDDYFAVLTYLLAKGQVPGPMDYLLWRYITEGDFKADRARILQVMGLVSGQDTSSCLPAAKSGAAPATAGPSLGALLKNVGQRH